MKAKKIEHLSDTQIIMLALNTLLKYNNYYYEYTIFTVEQIQEELSKRAGELRKHINLSERLKYYNDERTNIT